MILNVSQAALCLEESDRCNL